MRVEGVQSKETSPKDVTIVRMKTIPKLGVMIHFCKVARKNEGFTIVLKVLVVLKHVIFAIHSHSGRIIDEIV